MCDRLQNLYKLPPNGVVHELFGIEYFELLPNEIRKLLMGVILELPDLFYPQIAKKSSVNLCGLHALVGIICSFTQQVIKLSIHLER